MSETLKFGNGQWAVKKGSTLAYNSENSNYKPLPFTFDRSTSATRVNKQGLIEVVPNNEPRIDFLNDSNGALKLEPSRSNLITYSEDFTQGVWTKLTNSTAVANVAISPNGTQNSNEIKAVATSTSVLGIQDGFTVSLGVSYTISFFAKKGSVRYLQLFHGGAQVTGNPRTNFDLEDGVVTVSDAGHTSSIEDFGNGWFRCVVELNTLKTSLQTYFNAVKDANASRSAISSWSANDNFYLWGAQLEQGSYPTSYIPTQGSIGTRVAESCEQTNINTSIISSSYPFTIYVQSIVIATNPYVISFLNNSSPSQSYSIALSANQVYFGARANGTTENLFSGVTLTDGQTFKAAVTMENATSAKLSVNGIVVSKTDFTSQGANVNINDLLLGQLRTVSDTGHRLPIKEVKLYNKALTDAELAALTKI